MIETLVAELAQFEPGRVDGNLDLITERVGAAAGDGSPRLLVFPELALSGFPVHDRVPAERVGDSPRLARIERAAVAGGAHAVVGFAEAGPDGTLFNSAAVFGPRGLLAVVRKRHLPGLEARWFAAGGPPEVINTELGVLGVAICYDAWFPEYVKAQAVQGAEIIVNINSIWAGGSAGGIGDSAAKRRYWRVLPVARALDCQTYLLACNGCGRHDFGAPTGRWRRMGGSRIVDPAGAVLATAASGPATVTAVLTAAELDRARESIHLLADSEPAGPGAATRRDERHDDSAAHA